jgi:nitric oxide reductase subunit B
LWHARSSAFVESTGFQTFTWMCIVGGVIFTVGGVIPLVWFVTSRRKGLKKVSAATQLHQQQMKQFPQPWHNYSIAFGDYNF